MQKFEIYHYDRVFYSKEEIETMGLKLCAIKNLLKLTKNKNNFYDLVIYYSKAVQHTSLDMYFQNLKHEKVFFKDFGDHGVIIMFDKYYGVMFGSQSFVFDTEQERKEFIHNPELVVREKFDNFYTNTSSINTKYNNREQGNQKCMKLKEIIH